MQGTDESASEIETTVSEMISIIGNKALGLTLANVNIIQRLNRKLQRRLKRI